MKVPRQQRIIEASMCLACGISGESLAADREYGADVVDAAWPRRNSGIAATFRAALAVMGYRPSCSDRELVDEALATHEATGRIRAAGFSTVNLPGILGNVANKVLLDAFTNVEATYPLIAEKASFGNFQQHTMYRLDHLGEFAVVGNDGQLQHGNLGQTSFTNQLSTYGQLLTITRQDLINDNLHAFKSIPALIGRKARISIERSLYSKICESADSFYTSGQGNKLTGSLDIVSLAAAEAALLGMTDAYGDPIYAQPKVLLVPPSLKSLADQIYTSAEVRSTIADTTRPTDNPFRGRFQVVSSPFLSSPNIAGSSASTWYLIADPMVLPAFQVATLEGKDAPTVETSDTSFNVLGFQFRVYFDYAVAQLDYRGAVKNT